MRLFTPNHIFRVALAISVSLWMAGGGCLWGCSDGTVAAASLTGSTNDATVVVAGDSCQSKTHHCCSTKSSDKPTGTAQATLATSLGFFPSGMMQECPLALDASALTSKGNSDSTNQGQTPVSHLPKLEETSIQVNRRSSPVQFLNRGPTYLRCCVFLI